MSDQQQPTSAANAAPLLSRAGWARVLPFLAYIFFIFVVDMLTRAGFSPASLRWMYAVKIAVVSLILVKFWSEYSELKPPRCSPTQAVTAILVGVAV
ncbi:MAG: CPBP family intramembrane glutamate endopeptidase, partial [Gammaproteobacteria bacterium]